MHSETVEKRLQMRSELSQKKAQLRIGMEKSCCRSDFFSCLFLIQFILVVVEYYI
jgi:DNA-directed RNA polymerase subunit N (RpoN/RPB10)